MEKCSSRFSSESLFLVLLYFLSVAETVEIKCVVLLGKVFKKRILMTLGPKREGSQMRILKTE
jgi:hypothetical protein